MVVQNFLDILFGVKFECLFVKSKVPIVLLKMSIYPPLGYIFPIKISQILKFCGIL